MSPSDWNNGLLTPIPKPNTDPRDPMGYRGITLLSIPCKVYTDILNTRIQKWLEENNILADEQNGFREKRNCIDNIYALSNIINMRKTAKKSTFACFVDLRKAFDTVNRHCLWFKLMKCGINGKILNSIQALYTDVRCSVRVNDLYTDPFDVKQGVRQGCKLSPTLFSIYINDLAGEINDLRCGVETGDFMVSLLMYADDIVLLAPDEHQLQLMLSKLNAWCKKWHLEINIEKTNVIHFRSTRNTRSDYEFRCGDTVINYTDSYRYLGIWLNEFMDMHKTVKELCKSASRALSAIYTKFRSNSGMSFEIYTKLYTTLVEPVLFYGAGIWGTKSYREVQTIQNKACRFFLGVGQNSANTASLGDMGWISCSVQQRTEVMRTFFRVQAMPDNRTTKRIHNKALTINTSWDTKVIKMFENLNVSWIVREDWSIKRKISFLKDILINADKLEWTKDLWNDRNKPNGNKLRTYRTYMFEKSTSYYVKQTRRRDHRSVFAKFRNGSLPLLIETGRYTKPLTPLENRTCKFCSTPNYYVEDEKHFLIDCDFYSDLRETLFHKAVDLNNDFMRLNSSQKLIYLMNCHILVPLLVNTLFNMYKRRLFNTF